MSTRTTILAQQQKWAIGRGLEPDSRGYLRTVEVNLFQPLSEAARNAFALGSGNELFDTASRPAKMRALHSSSALAVNFFDYWTVKDSRPLASALNLSDDIESIQFEGQFPTGLTGTPPNIDVVLRLSGDHIIGIESKFTEWLNRKPKNKVPFKSKYFDSGSLLWTSAGLPKCQEVAEALKDGLIIYSYLDAPQLLKHTLGMGSVIDGDWSLFYIYFDCPGRESNLHREELADFKTRVGDEIRFRAITYQELSRRLSSSMGNDAEYLRYIVSRYTI